jgi:hypothetical protein
MDPAFINARMGKGTGLTVSYRLIKIEICTNINRGILYEAIPKGAELCIS